MKRTYFVVCLLICFTFVSVKVLGLGGLLNSRFDTQEKDSSGEFWLHDGIDVCAGEGTTLNPIRPVIDAPMDMIELLIKQEDLRTRNKNGSVWVKLSSSPGIYIRFAHSLNDYDNDIEWIPTELIPLPKSDSNIKELCEEVQYIYRYDYYDKK